MSLCRCEWEAANRPSTIGERVRIRPWKCSHWRQHWSQCKACVYLGRTLSSSGIVLTADDTNWYITSTVGMLLHFLSFQNIMISLFQDVNLDEEELLAD